MTGKANDGVSEFTITDTPSSVEERGDYLFIDMYLYRYVPDSVRNLF